MEDDRWTSADTHGRRRGPLMTPREAVRPQPGQEKAELPTTGSDSLGWGLEALSELFSPFFHPEE